MNPEPSPALPVVLDAAQDTLEFVHPGRSARFRGVLDQIESRAGPRYRAAAAVLLLGGSYELAANAAGMSRNALDRTRKQKPDIGQMLAECESAGFGMFETELVKRAMAGAQDRSSMRALETVLKSRRAEYREKVMASIEVMHRAESRGIELVSGWSEGEQVRNETEET